ncbi:hypothetical protein Metho_1189 [Methanomethylovorans hollandica DSM 15978]|uniref:Uncharacterized protein n=1 Tax=Methanomethylovorans hollandica (strain DSM 15978 / NBRC 107637 / DMS1) TaxID=867904 RepID=L0KZK4_METHD|nr:hypothetical protein [Methanomethylovorans hollandica]AGB49419.1 hypothetical protein Metho_1189 [Methanomethylovorans hollandica DSM 15978]
MDLEETTDNRKKKTKSFALDENLVEKLEKLSKRGDYGSQSNIVSVALYEFFSKHGVVADSREVETLIQEYMHSTEGEALIRTILQRALASHTPQTTDDPGIINHY